MTNTVTNQNKPSGLTPVKYLNGANWTGGGNIYFVPSTDTNNYAVGDLVSAATGADQWSGIQTCVLSTVASTQCLGVVLGVGASPNALSSLRGGPYIDPTNLTLIQAPATKTKNYFLLVEDDPKVVYEIQETGVGTTPATSLTYLATSKNASFLYTAPATGVAVSGTLLDNGVSSTRTPGASIAAGYFLRIMGLSQKIDPQTTLYNTFGLYAKWLVKLINHVYDGTTAGL